jgi:hypothetical protein
MWKRKIYYKVLGCPPRDRGAVAWLEWVVGFIGGAKPWGRERVSGL